MCDHPAIANLSVYFGVTLLNQPQFSVISDLIHAHIILFTGNPVMKMLDHNPTDCINFRSHYTNYC